MKNKRLVVISAIFGAILTSLIMSQPASAVSTNWGSTVTKKALLSGVRRCYQQKAMTQDVGLLSKFTYNSKIVSGGTNEDFIALPTGLTNITDNAVSCEQLLYGYGSGSSNTFEGVLSLAGKSNYGSTTAAKETFLQGMGYAYDEVEDNKKCAKLYFNEKNALVSSSSGVEIETDSVCADIENGKISSLSIEPTGSYNTIGTYGAPFFTITNDGKVRFNRFRKKNDAHGYTTYSEVDTTAGVGSVWEDFVSNLRQTASAAAGGSGFTYEVSVHDGTLKYTYTYIPKSDSSALEGDRDRSYYLNKDQATAIWTAISYLSDNQITSADEINFSKEEKISLLLASMKNYFYAGKSESEYWACDVSSWDDYGAFPAEYRIYITSSGSYSKNCRINPNIAVNSGTIKGFSGSSFDANGLSSSNSYNLKQTIEQINELVGKIEDENPDGDLPIIGETQPGPDAGSTPNCYNSTDLGWILCSVLTITGGAVDGIYQDVADNWLMVKTSEVGADIEQGWETFQNFANIFFVIMLLLVILSQVTNLGISNYGIKKILPSLIIVAVLVNLSLIMCRIAVDASNIAGDTIYNLFGNLKVSSSNANVSVGSIVNTLLETVGIGAATTAIATFGGIQAGGAIVLVLIGLVSALISTLFFFILLAVRKVGILILVVLSPIAIICYALPNTKNLFSRWVKLFASLLMVYPICGMLMGASKFFSKILLANDQNGLIANLVAMLLQVVPFFLVPGLIRSSLALAGNIGARISNMGSRLSHGAAGAIAGAGITKRLSTWANAQQAQRSQARNNRPMRTSGFGGVWDRARQRYYSSAVGRAAKSFRDRRDARAGMEYKKQRLADTDAAIEAEALKDPALFEQSIKDQEATMREKADQQRIVDAANRMLRNGEVDPNNSIDFGDQYHAALDNYAKNPTDAAAKLRANALMYLQSTKGGGKGRETLAEEVYSRAFNATDESQRAVARSMAQQMLSDDKLRAQYHANDPATEKMLMDVASGNIYKDANRTKFKGRGDYAGAISSGLRPDTVGSLDDSVYNSLNAMDPISGEYRAAMRTLEEAVANSVTAGKIKDGDLQRINDLRKREYDALRDQWITTGSNVKINGKAVHGFVEDGGVKYVTDASGHKIKNNGSYVTANEVYSAYAAQFGSFTQQDRGSGPTMVIPRP